MKVVSIHGNSSNQLTPPQFDNLIIVELLEFLDVKFLKKPIVCFHDGVYFIH